MSSLCRMLALVLLSLLPCALSLPLEEEQIVPVTVPQLGGWKTLPTNSGGVRALGRLSEQWYNRRSNGEYWYRMKEVESASMQVVFGVNYELVFTMEPTGCLKEEKQKNVDCQLPPSGSDHMVQQCRISFLKQSWKNLISVTDGECQPQTA